MNLRKKALRHIKQFKRFCKKSNFRRVLMKGKYNCYCYKVTGLRYGERDLIPF